MPVSGLGNRGEEAPWLLGPAGLITWEGNPCEAARGVLSSQIGSLNTPDARRKGVTGALSQSLKHYLPVTRIQHHDGKRLKRPRASTAEIISFGLPVGYAGPGASRKV